MNRILSLVVLYLVASALYGQIRIITVPTPPDHHPSRVLVKFRGPPAPLPNSAILHGFRGDPNLFLIANPQGLSVPEVVARYLNNTQVVYVEPDYVMRAIGIPSDPLWSQQWDMVKIAAPQAWDTQTDASDVVVAIIDTGINFSHPDVGLNIWNGPSGAHGYTCIGSCIAGGADDQGHGTHVAGTIGAWTNNGIGIAGLNWSVQLLAIKFLDQFGSGNLSDAILAFDKVVELRQQGYNVRVTNNSWGGGPFMQSLKEAMARAETAGVLHVCAAGNSGQNADVAPMYPAAYDNRGIISVLATDSNDIGAGFTNYGHARVDIAAPGVSTLSTVPTFSCSLCDPSGYRLLSGTSMASPHVTGVMAALFHRNPNLTPNEARDVVLDPASYDLMTEPRAATSSTGGRLNFAKAIANPLLITPRLNGFPTADAGNNILVNDGQAVTITGTASDPDGDPLRTAMSKVSNSTLFLLGPFLDSIFPTANGNSVTFTAPLLAQPVATKYAYTVADGRGGSAIDEVLVSVIPTRSAGLPPGANLTVTPTSGPIGTTVSISFPLVDPEGKASLWELWSSAVSTASGWCCMSPGTTTATYNNAGVYRISVLGLDQDLNFSSRQSAVVKIGGAVGEPPLLNLVQDKLAGPVPLNAVFDLTGSTDADGVVTQALMFPFGNGVTCSNIAALRIQCTVTEPGSYWSILQVQDNSGKLDTTSVYLTAYGDSIAPPPPPPPPPPTPVTVTITNPVNGPIPRKARISIDTAVDGSVHHVDTLINNQVVCSDTTVPYQCPWNVPAAAHKTYTLVSKAYSGSGQVVGTSPAVIVESR